MNEANTQTTDAVSWLEQYRKMRNFEADRPGAEAMRTLGVDLWFDEPRFEFVQWVDYLDEFDATERLCGKTLSRELMIVAGDGGELLDITVEIVAQHIARTVAHDAGAVRATAAEALAKGHTPDERIYARALELCAEKPKEETSINGQ